MSADAGVFGRQSTLTIAGVGNIAFQEKSVSINNEMVDTTNDNSGGWVTKLAEPGVRSIEITGSGLVQNYDLFISAVNNTSQVYACTLTHSEGTSFAGDFALPSVSNAMPTSEGQTFELTLSSTGEVIATPGA